MKIRCFPLLLAVALASPAVAGNLPLPDAPIRVVIPDAAAFDGALAGSWRSALEGDLSGDDPFVAAWRQTQVGGKLEAQWEKLSPDLPWTWKTIRSLHPKSVGLSLLAVGNLEAVLVVETSLAILPAPLPTGTPKSHAGVTYHLVARGAGDDSPDPVRRMGLAWAQASGRLFLATSERGLLLALDAAQSGSLFAAPLPGLLSVDLDLEALRRDRYFKREFPFPTQGDQGHVRAALRLEGGTLVEVREGKGETLPPAVTFDTASSVAAGWEPGDYPFFDALRRGLLEPVPQPSDRPVPSLLPLPGLESRSEDPYLVNLEKPRSAQGEAPWEEGELSAWRDLLSSQPVPGWGYLLGRGGERRLVLAWPKAKDDSLVELCRKTAERRAGAASVAIVGDAREIRVGPGLPALAVRRMGDFVWIGASALDLTGAPLPRAGSDVVRWGFVDLGAVRGEAGRWRRAEGPENAGQVRPFSDRILGLLGWVSKTRSIRVERRQSDAGWTERVAFSSEP